MSTEQTRRPLRFDYAVGCLVPMTDEQLAEAGWTRLPNGNFRKDA